MARERGRETCLMSFCVSLRYSLLLALIVTLLTGCGGTSAVAPSGGAPGAPTDYHIGAGDQIRITIFNQTNLSGDFTIDGSGSFPFPLIGLIEAGNKTPKELAHTIAEKLAKGGFLVNPNVAVQVTQFRPYYILGEVTSPGVYPYTVNMTVIKAVAAAKGFTYRANTHKVYIQRSGEAVERVYKLTPAVLVAPGDTVRIPERLF